jgi:uncharacterized protein (TIGR02453 family)
MARTFPGFSPKALSFFRQLERNNKREWFQPRKDQFEQLCREPMLELVAQVVEDLRDFAVDHVPSDPKRAVYRIYRDTRFSNDKSPYKTHIAAIFPHARLPKHGGAGYYFAVSHEGLSIGGGVYGPGPVEMAAVRDAIAKDERRFRKFIDEKRLRKQMGELQGEQLSRVPKGFAADHPAGDLLRRKQWYFYTTLDAAAATKSTVRKTVTERFRLLSPLMEWLNAAVLRAVREEDAKADENRPARPTPMF